MKCKICKATAVVALRSHNAAFCPDCYLKFFARQVEKGIEGQKLFTRDERILVALSGGKDSLALMLELSRQGYDVTGLHIDLGIPESSPVARGVVERFCAKHGLKLMVKELAAEGLAIPLVKERLNRPVCSACGKIKRHFFNKVALDEGFDALATSAGESVFLNEKSGGIALFTTTRTVYSGPNLEINRAIINNLFTRNGDGRHRTLGEVLQEAKSSLGSDSNKLKFMLIGDPALRLSFPDYEIVVTEINGEPVDVLNPTTIKALERVTVLGEIRTPEGAKDTQFNGTLRSTIFDSRQTITTLDNFGTGEHFEYTDYPNTLYTGNDSVRGGEFSFTFTVPKDITYSNDFGKMNFYAFSEQDSIEAQGSFLDFRVGGTSDTGTDDTAGPEIRYFYLNDTTFTDGGKVNLTPLFVASLWDQSGINITGSSIGHDMMLIIDNQVAQSYTLNDYYELTGDDGSGRVVFSIPELKPGMHTAEFKVWDVLNNSTTQTFTFEAVEDLDPQLINLYASPTPARGQVTFYLEHNLPESQLNVRIEVFDMAGRLRWSHEENGASEAFESYQVTWNLMGNGSGRMLPGVYIYRASLRAGKSQTVSDAKKMIILAQ